MKKSFIPSALQATVAGIAFLALGAAQAQVKTNSGEITFAGSISPSTCSIQNDHVKRRIPMGMAKPADFKSAGDVKGETPFDITLEGCTVGAGIPAKATVKFSGANVNPNNRLNNTGNAKGVDIVINSNGVNALSTPTQIDLVAGNNTLNFIAAYHATTAEVTGGSVISQVNFDITYQ